jgi:hypothetical protein
MNSASLAMKRRISQGQAMRLLFGRSRVTHLLSMLAFRLIGTVGDICVSGRDASATCPLNRERRNRPIGCSCSTNSSQAGLCAFPHRGEITACLVAGGGGSRKGGQISHAAAGFVRIASPSSRGKTGDSGGCNPVWHRRPTRSAPCRSAPVPPVVELEGSHAIYVSKPGGVSLRRLGSSKA